MGGILSAFRKEPNAAWLVLACDLPYLNHETIVTLIKKRNPFKMATAYVSATQPGRPGPLCAIYEPKSIHRLLHFAARGSYCPRKVLIRSDVELLEPVDAQALNNINTPEHYEEAMKTLHHDKR